MSRPVLLVAFLLSATGCATTIGPTPDPARVTVVQKNSKPIPGFEGALTIRIYNIRWGKVLFEIGGVDGRTIVDTISVKQNDVIPFVFDGRKYYVRVVQLKNALAGDDHAVFEVSTRQPTQDRGATRKDKGAHNPRVQPDVAKEPRR